MLLLRVSVVQPFRSVFELSHTSQFPDQNLKKGGLSSFTVDFSAYYFRLLAPAYACTSNLQENLRSADAYFSGSWKMPRSRCVVRFLDAYDIVFIFDTMDFLAFCCRILTLPASWFYTMILAGVESLIHFFYFFTFSCASPIAPLRPKACQGSTFLSAQPPQLSPQSGWVFRNTSPLISSFAATLCRLTRTIQLEWDRCNTERVSLRAVPDTLSLILGC